MQPAERLLRPVGQKGRTPDKQEIIRELFSNNTLITPSFFKGSLNALPVSSPQSGCCGTEQCRTPGMTGTACPEREDTSSRRLRRSFGGAAFTVVYGIARGGGNIFFAIDHLQRSCKGRCVRIQIQTRAMPGKRRNRQ